MRSLRDCRITHPDLHDMPAHASNMEEWHVRANVVNAWIRRMLADRTAKSKQGAAQA